jgi:hypothetical protein
VRACTNDDSVNCCAVEVRVCAHSLPYTGVCRGTKDRTVPAYQGAAERRTVTTRPITAHGIHTHEYFLYATLHQLRSDYLLQSKLVVVAGRFPVVSWVCYWRPWETRVCPKCPSLSYPESRYHRELPALPSVLLRVTNGKGKQGSGCSTSGV